METYRHITVTPLQAALGAEISGVDLAGDMGEAVAAEIMTAFARHLVLFFRDQELTPALQVAFAARFGPVGRYPFAEPIDGHPGVVAIIKEPGQRSNFGGIWHTDTPYLERPSLASMLYARQVPRGGGDTLWANTTAAYEALPDELKAQIAGLRAVNSAAKNKAALRLDHLEGGAMRGRNTGEVSSRQAIHPVVRAHPVTHRRALYLSPAHVLRFDGWSEAASAPLLERLFAHMTGGEFSCRLRWRRGTLAVWDNRCTLHYPINDYHGQRREMHRVTIDGERPVQAV